MAIRENDLVVGRSYRFTRFESDSEGHTERATKNKRVQAYWQKDLDILKEHQTQPAEAIVQAVQNMFWVPALATWTYLGHYHKALHVNIPGMGKAMLITSELDEFEEVAQ